MSRPYPPNCHKNNYKYTNVIKKDPSTWAMATSPPLENRLLLKNVILGLDVLQHIGKEWMHLRIVQC